LGSAHEVVKQKHAQVLARVALALVGLAIVAYLVRDSGPERVASVLWQSGRWVPLVFALELVQLSSDFFALRSILGERRSDIPAGTWVRAMSVAYAMMSLLPAGRVAGEVTRGTLFAKHVGAPRAATTGTQMQAAYLAANAVLSLAAWIVVASRFGLQAPLALLLAGNVVFQAVVSGGLLAILRDARVGRWISDVRKRLFKHAPVQPPLDPAVRKRIPYGAMIACTAGRSAQVVQYAVILHAVGGVVTVPNAFIAHGIHLVGASLGDLLPNQLGVTDGIYRAFAGDLGFAAEPARALSIAFVVRIAQLSLSAVCVVVTALMKQSEPRDLSSPASARADARS
jgi:hypothetical protein